MALHTIRILHLPDKNVEFVVDVWIGKEHVDNQYVVKVKSLNIWNIVDIRHLS